MIPNGLYKFFYCQACGIPEDGLCAKRPTLEALKPVPNAGLESKVLGLTEQRLQLAKERNMQADQITQQRQLEGLLQTDARQQTAQPNLIYGGIEQAPPSAVMRTSALDPNSRAKAKGAAVDLARVNSNQFASRQPDSDTAQREGKAMQTISEAYGAQGPEDPYSDYYSGYYSGDYSYSDDPYTGYYSGEYSDEAGSRRSAPRVGAPAVAPNLATNPLPGPASTDSQTSSAKVLSRDPNELERTSRYLEKQTQLIQKQLSAQNQLTAESVGMKL